MPFVMVPVPAELEDEFGQWLLGHSLRAKLDAWPKGSVDAVVDQADELTVAMLRHLAFQADVWATVEEVADGIGSDGATVHRLATAVNEHCTANTWPAMILVKLGEGVTAGSPAVESLLMGGPARVEVRRILGT